MKEVAIPEIAKLSENSEVCLTPLLHESIFHTMSDYITEDIQLKILKQLPVKTLLRFRCVCKWWKQTIDSQQFVEDHLALQKRCLIIECKLAKYLIAHPYELPLFDTLIAPTPERLRLVGTLHGVVCFYNANQYNFLLWNPNIRRCITFKGGPFEWYLYDEEVYMVGSFRGFWIDPLTKDFKIIGFMLLDDDEEEGDEYPEYWVYSSISGEWNNFNFGDDLKFHYGMEVAPAVVMESVGYWIVHFDTEADNVEENVVGVAVLPFDFVKESFLEPVYALSVKRGYNLPVLCDRNGALSLVYIDPERWCNIFVRKEDKWVLVDALSLFPFVKRCIWGVVEVQEKKKNYVMVLATTSDDLLMLDNSDPNAVICSWALLTSQIEESNTVVANGFVDSLVFPEDAIVQRIAIESQPPTVEGDFSSTIDVCRTQLFPDIEGVNKKRRLYELGPATNACVSTGGSKELPSSSQSQDSQQVDEDVDGRVQAIEARIAELKAEIARIKLAHAEHAAAEQRIEELVRAEVIKMIPTLLVGDDIDDSRTP